MCLVIGCTSDTKHTGGYCKRHYQRIFRHGDPLAGRTFQGEPLAFMEALPATGISCITWPFSIDPNGRPSARATRIVCEKFHGAPPTPKHQAAHSCGKGHEACVAPYHLSWKTCKDNNADKVAHGTMLIGEDSPVSKITKKQASEIRRLASILPYSEVGKRFGITKTTVHDIVSRRTWKF